MPPTKPNSTKLILCCLLIVTGFISAFCCVPVHAADVSGDAGTVELQRLAISQFAAFGKAMGIAPEELQNPKVVNYGTWIATTTEKWAWRVDVAGNQVFRPTSVTPHLIPHITSTSSGISIERQKAMLAIATNLASVLKLDTIVSLSKSTVKKEILTFQKCGYGERIYFPPGRYLVRLMEAGGDKYFEVMFGTDDHPLRIDTNIVGLSINRARQILIQKLRLQNGAAIAEEDTPLMTFGTFFSMAEYRFESDAKSYEGQPFEASLGSYNPYNPKTQGYDWGRFEWWHRYGRVSAMRGNWNPVASSWQRSQVHIAHHPYDDYSIAGGFGASLHMGPDFYRDLEHCTIAAFFGHGGPVDDNFQLGKGWLGRKNEDPDQWFIPGSKDFKYGSGDLRHLLFPSCGAMGLASEAEGKAGYKSLISEWMPAQYVNGLRTACGYDGGSSGSDIGGWRLFGHYNQGDSISDSWALAAFDECDTNYAVTVAYGATLESAVDTLLDGRFSTEQAKPVWSVASVWSEPGFMPLLIETPENAVWFDTYDITKIDQQWGKAHARVSIAGGALRVAGKEYLQGIGTHAESKFAINLKHCATRFTATVGVDEAEKSASGSVIFEVWVDNHFVAKSPLMKKGDSFNFDVDLTGAKLLGLLVTDGGDGIDSDHADWCDALLYLDPKATEKPEAIDIK